MTTIIYSSNSTATRCSMPNCGLVAEFLTNAGHPICSRCYAKMQRLVL